MCLTARPRHRVYSCDCSRHLANSSRLACRITVTAPPTAVIKPAAAVTTAANACPSTGTHAPT